MIWNCSQKFTRHDKINYIGSGFNQTDWHQLKKIINIIILLKKVWILVKFHPKQQNQSKKLIDFVVAIDFDANSNFFVFIIVNLLKLINLNSDPISKLIQWNAENRMSEIGIMLKSEGLTAQTSLVRISHVRFVRTFGFRTATKLDHLIYKDGHKKNFYKYKTV